MNDVTAFADIAARVRNACAVDGSLSEQSRRRFLDILDRFNKFVASFLSNARMAHIDLEVVRAFVTARSASASAGVATQHLRRSVLRYFFRTASQLSLSDADPTWNLVLPPRSIGLFRALTDDEVVLCRSFSQHTLSETRQPCAWALAEATATTSELPYITIGDFDLDACRVWLQGGSKTLPRFGYLNDWGITQIQNRIANLGKRTNSDTRLIYRSNGSQEAKQASACVAISDILARAGISGEPDIRPSSVSAWAGQQIFTRTNDIGAVAQRLGMRSLDRAARFIGYDWQNT